MVVNLQGDLPTLDPRLVRSCLAALATTTADIGTIAAVITREEERTDPNVVKVVGTPLKGGQTVRGLYFTGRPPPMARVRSITTSASMPIVGRLCIVSCRCRHRRSRLREKLEQLRAIEAGMRIHVGLVDTVPLGVDTPADLKRARELSQIPPSDSPPASRRP